MAEALAACVGVHTPSRLEGLRTEIENYALGLVRARMGLLRIDGQTAPEGAAGSPARLDCRFQGQGNSQATGAGGSRVPGTPRAHSAAREDLERFCQLTGASPEHLNGHGSNLAGIAFYFRVFTVLTSRRQIPTERLEMLLQELRRCRQQLDAFVFRWTSTRAGLSGLTRSAEVEGLIQDLRSALGRAG
ncbi:MAG: hypothetical protein D6766_03915 [Verrucomicrobia bacterium]|nr:MAG: hypothetical protein D6766_03915 [Verrucomicrobiota bacterium]